MANAPTGGPERREGAGLSRRCQRDKYVSRANEGCYISCHVERSVMSCGPTGQGLSRAYISRRVCNATHKKTLNKILIRRKGKRRPPPSPSYPKLNLLLNLTSAAIVAGHGCDNWLLGWVLPPVCPIPRHGGIADHLQLPELAFPDARFLAFCKISSLQRGRNRFFPIHNLVVWLEPIFF